MTIRYDRFFKISTLSLIVSQTPALGGEIEVFPGESLQSAISSAVCGDTIRLKPGSFHESIIIPAMGCSSSAPLTISGPRNAVLHGGSRSRILEINGDHVHLSGFTIDGLHGNSADSDDYHDKLLFVTATQAGDTIQGLKVTFMTFQNAGGECIRFRYFVQNSEVAYNTITNCGAYDFKFDEGGKNGEGVYIGTSSKQWNDGKNPTNDPDESSYNWIHDNIINTGGNECIEVKEGGEFNLLEHNVCSGQLDADAAGIGFRGSNNIAQFNQIFSNVGAGIRVGGHIVNGIIYGVNNTMVGNVVHHNSGAGFKIKRNPQGAICDNDVFENLGGDLNTDFEVIDPSASCGSEPIDPIELVVAAVTASDYDDRGPYVPENTLDDDLSPTSRWSAKGDGQWINYDLGTLRSVDSLNVAFYRGDERTTTISIETSLDDVSWEVLLDHASSSGNTLDFESFDLEDTQARFVRLIGHGNSFPNDDWMRLAGVEVFGY